MTIPYPASIRRDRGQSLVEFALVMPLALLIVLGLVEVGYALLDQQIVTKITREGSNLISRDTTLQAAGAAVTSMSSRPVNFSTTSKMIFSVIKKGAISGTANYDQLALYQRYEVGNGSGTSRLTMRGGGSFGGAPDYTAVNADTNSGLQITNLDPNLISARGGMIYVTEVFSRHPLITPLDRLGIVVPQTLYSIAYF